MQRDVVLENGVTAWNGQRMFNQWYQKCINGLRRSSKSYEGVWKNGSCPPSLNIRKLQNRRVLPGLFTKHYHLTCNL